MHNSVFHNPKTGKSYKKVGDKHYNPFSDRTLSDDEAFERADNLFLHKGHFYTETPDTQNPVAPRNKQAFYRGFLKAADRHKTAEVNYSAVLGGIGAVGGGVLGGLSSRKHRMRNALIGAGVGGAAAYGGAKTFQHFYNQDTDNYLSKNLKRDVTGKNQFVLDSFKPAGYGKDPKDIPEFLQKYPDNSVFIDSHAHSYLPGNYRWRPRNPLTGPGSGMTDWIPDKHFKNQFTLEDIVKQMGPGAAEKIQYYGDMSCKGSKCAPTPEDIRKFFPNLKEIVMVPKGGIGTQLDLSKPRTSSLLSDQSDLMGHVARQTAEDLGIDTIGIDVDDIGIDHVTMEQMKARWNKGWAYASPMRYTAGPEGWTNQGSFNMQGTPNKVTTPFVFDDEGVKNWLLKN